MGRLRAEAAALLPRKLRSSRVAAEPAFRHTCECTARPASARSTLGLPSSYSSPSKSTSHHLVELGGTPPRTELPMVLKATLNCDCGESFGQYTIVCVAYAVSSLQSAGCPELTRAPGPQGDDEGLFAIVDIANCACGEHGGDFNVMAKTVKLAQKYGVKIGAHPSLPDRQGFGRRKMYLPTEDFFNCLLAQTGALAAFLKLNGLEFNHFKPHGQAYIMAVSRLFSVPEFQSNGKTSC